MTTISFRFKEGMSAKDQEDALVRLAQLTGVFKAARLLPSSTDPVVQRMGNVYVRPGADPATVLRQVTSLPEVEAESPEVPPVRYLV